MQEVFWYLVLIIGQIGTKYLCFFMVSVRIKHEFTKFHEVQNFSFFVTVDLSKQDKIGFVFFLSGIPLVIVSLVLAIDKDAYGNTLLEEAAVELQSTDHL